MATGWKRIAEILMARGGGAQLASRYAGRASIVLAYHNIVPTGEAACGDLSLHVDQEVFGQQLDFLTTLSEVVPLEQAVSREDSGSRSRLRIAITFDDAYRGTMTAGVSELVARSLPATVFVPPGLLGTAGFWWDRLSLPGGGLEPGLRDRALLELHGDADHILAWADIEGRGLVRVPTHAQAVSEAELLNASLPENILFGAHTWGHPNLTALAAERIAEELVRSKEWLASRTSRYVNWLAYPYGLQNDAVVEAAARHFDGALVVDGGFSERRGTWSHPVHATPRLNVPRGLSLEGLALRLAGLLA